MSKTLRYKQIEVVIEDPAKISFTDNETQDLYTFLFNQIGTRDYTPTIDADSFCLGQAKIVLDAYGASRPLGSIKPISAKATNKVRLLQQHRLRHFFELYPIFSGLVNNCITSTSVAIALAQQLLGQSISADNFIDLKRIIDDVNRKNWTRDRDTSEGQSGVSTLGSISEKLLETVFMSMLKHRRPPVFE